MIKFLLDRITNQWFERHKPRLTNALGQLVAAELRDEEFWLNGFKFSWSVSVDGDIYVKVEREGKELVSENFVLRRMAWDITYVNGPWDRELDRTITHLQNQAWAYREATYSE